MLPTMTTKWNEGKYVAPANWHRGEPCTCDDCPTCDEWETRREPILLTVADEDKCYSGSNLPGVLPDITTVAQGWCVKIRSTGAPVSFVPYESMNGGGVEIVIDGIEWDMVLVANGEMCICYLDSTHWSANGDAVGYNGGT